MQQADIITNRSSNGTCCQGFQNSAADCEGLRAVTPHRRTLENFPTSRFLKNTENQ